ncbi:unnamed protein product [Heligmosomoides polygyrus]|uniref:SPK domain-containing protein n=1 Tax=Heligmosomoides polygyrus TaxID=6339 RepID=A0A183GFS0_HELPZ|nr:unnamed protein product [Heligmosomoides polygyrus]
MRAAESHVPYRNFSNKIKEKFEDASTKDIHGGSLKCLVFLPGLTDSSLSDIRLRLLNRLNCLKEDDPSPSLDEFVSDCETFVVLRSDNRPMESKQVNATYHKMSSGKQRRRSSRNVASRHIDITRSTSRTELDFYFQKNRFLSKEVEIPTTKYSLHQCVIKTQDARTHLKVEINGFSSRL